MRWPFKKILKFNSIFITCWVISAFTMPAYAESNRALSSETQQAIVTHMALLHEFQSMYEHKHFSPGLFDTQNGYLQTVFSDQDKMPLSFFINYNNMWWFQIIDKVVVPAVSYDPQNNTGAIVLEIYYDKTFVLRAMQYVKFTGDKISYIRTYASPAFFLQEDPLIQLDSYGNQIFLSTGYDLKYSAQAALFFFKSPKGQAFVSNPRTAAAVVEIQKNLKKYLNHPS